MLTRDPDVTNHASKIVPAKGGGVGSWEVVRFAVSKVPLEEYPHPVISLDGAVPGADLIYDHHSTGEPVNLLTIPEEVPSPGTLATTMIDTDSIVSAAVYLLRAVGEREVLAEAWPVLYEAAHYCDHLVPSGFHREFERRGLGLHCWLKDRGFSLIEVSAMAAGSYDRNRETGIHRIVATAAVRADAYRALSLAVVEGVRHREVPCDYSYLERLSGIEERAQRSIIHRSVKVTVLSEWVDPLALYRAVETGLAVIRRPIKEGAWKYVIGVHPDAANRIDLRPVLRRLDGIEPGWGGRSNAGGSPVGSGSRLELETLIGILEESY